MCLDSGRSNVSKTNLVFARPDLAALLKAVWGAMNIVRVQDSGHGAKRPWKALPFLMKLIQEAL